MLAASNAIARAKADVVKIRPKAIASYIAEIEEQFVAPRDRGITKAYGIIRRLVDQVVVYLRARVKPSPSISSAASPPH